MAQNNESIVLKVSLIVFTVLTLVYGIGYLFFPQTLVDLSGGGSVPSGWLRWSGGVLISLGIGAILVFRNLEKQDTLVITFALGTLFSGLALLYNLFFAISGNTWFTALPAIITLISSALLWWGRFQARDILKYRKSD
jgi:hypothetical protein